MDLQEGCLPLEVASLLAYRKKWPSRSAVSLAVGAVAALALISGCGRQGAAGLMPKPKVKPKVIGFYVNGQGGAKSTLQARARQINVVSPFWYRVGSGGQLKTNNAEAAMIRWAHQKKMHLWPLVGNAGNSVLSTAASRKAAVSALAAKAKTQGYDGLLVDFELLPPSQRAHLTSFVQDLSSVLHKEGKKVAVAVFPKINVPYSVNGVYDYKALGKAADAVIVMTYDRHDNTAPPGPVAPLNWVAKNARHAATLIPKDKLYLGVATYGYDWSAGGGSAKTVTTAQAIALAKSQGVTVQWSSSAQEPHFTYTQGGTKHTVWFEDAASFRQKLNLVAKLGLAGIGVWELGGEQPTFWKFLQQGGNPKAAVAFSSGRPTA